MPRTASTNSSGTVAAPAKLPPEERFWKKYSPHYEFPLSSVGSLVAHGIAGAGLLLISYAFIHVGQQAQPLPMDTVVIAGGGGSPEGEGDAPGTGAPAASRQEAVQDNQQRQNAVTDPSAEKAPVDADPLKAPITADPLKLPEFSSDRILESSNSSLSGLKKLSEDTQRQMLQGLAVAGKGQGGPGSGGGKGAGRGKGEGDLEGEGKGHISVRQKRLLRWTMIFDVHRGGEEYLHQLAALGAIIAIPDPRGGHRVIRDLHRRPAVGKFEDLAKINRIFWVDDKPETVGALCMALGVRPVPPHVVAFFPQTFEAELLDKELRYRGKQEDEITETKFEIRNNGGRYTPVVIEQH